MVDKKGIAAHCPRSPRSSVRGGVPSVALFLHRVIEDSGIFQADLFSVASSARDASSIRFLSPSSWFRVDKIVDGVWQGIPYRHFGAFLSEFEFQRYQPRRILTDALNCYDIIQIIAGSPAWALVGRNARPPVFLQVATLIRSERSPRLSRESGPMGIWRRAMTSITERYDFDALRHVEAVFVENDWMFSRLQQDGGCKDVIFAPPGVDTAVFCPSRERCDNFILSVARFDDVRKNVRLLFTAYAVLRQKFIDAPRLVLTGKTGPKKGDWELAKSLGIEEHIEFREDVPTDELASLFRNAALFVLPSDEEGLGIVLLEAMASGTPVVSTRCGGPETIIVDEDTGFLTPVGDAQALAARMQQLLESPQLRCNMGARGRQTIEARFSLVVAGRAFLDKYEEILSRRGNSCAV